MAVIEITEEQIFEGLQIEYSDWKGGPFSFENGFGRLDELDELTREQFNRFVAELGSTRCELCASTEGAPICGECLDKIESDRYAAGKGK